MQIRLDQLLIELALRLIGSQNVDPVGALGSLIRSDHDHTVGASLLRALTVGIEPDDHLVSTVAEILCLGLSLAAVPGDGKGLAIRPLGISLAFVKARYCHCGPLDSP